MTKESIIVVPELGESISQGTIASIAKKEGDFIEIDELLGCIETDKIAIEITSSFNGIIKKLYFKNGDTVNIGDKIAEIEEKQNLNKINSEKIKIKNNDNSIDQSFSPAAKKILNEENLENKKISGTGKNLMVTKSDVLESLSSSQSDVLESLSSSQSEVKNESAVTINTSYSPIDTLSTGSTEKVVKMSNMRLAIAKNLKSSQHNSVTLTTFNEINMSEVMKIRKKYKENFLKKHDTKLGFMSFFVKASVKALQEIPEINAEILDSNILYKDYCNIGVAVGTEKGLVVPVLKNAEKMSFAKIEKQIINYANKARKFDIKVSDMSGGTFTITNGGIYGSLLSTPIINPPQSGILGLHSIVNRPIVNDNGDIVSAPMMYVALSYDHRIVDGKGAVTFLYKIKQYIEDPHSLLLEI